MQKTTATLAGASGTYDIVETYGFVIPQYGSQDKLAPLNDLFTKYADKYKLNDISKDMRAAMTYDGKLYALPMQAQMYIMAYRKDVFDQVGLQPPKTFEEMKTAAKTIQEKAGIKYPIALPWLGDRGHRHRRTTASSAASGPTSPTSTPRRRTSTSRRPSRPWTR